MSILPTRPVLLGMLVLSVACSRKGDSAFSTLQERGKMAMGVDQYASTHQFDVLPNGGRIALEMSTDDALAIAQIRAHLKLIEHAFQAGDFSTPEFVDRKSVV